jgi:hydroxymethylglutaryl-CoA reductase
VQYTSMEHPLLLFFHLFNFYRFSPQKNDEKIKRKSKWHVKCTLKTLRKFIKTVGIGENIIFFIATQKTWDRFLIPQWRNLSLKYWRRTTNDTHHHWWKNVIENIITRQKIPLGLSQNTKKSLV